LSKAHKLSQRFNEDVDYRIVSQNLETETKTRQRKILSGFKQLVIERLNAMLPFDETKVLARNANRFFALEMGYSTSATCFPP